MYEIELRSIPERTVLSINRHVDLPGTERFFRDAFASLRAAGPGLEGIAGAPFLVFYGEVSEDSDGPVEVCIPVHAEPNDGADVLRREPAHREAYARITKADVDYPQILSAYQAVEQWLRSQERMPSGSPREVYFADWDASAPTDEVCDVAFPVS